MNYYEKRINFLRTEVMDKVFKLAEQEQTVAEMFENRHPNAREADDNLESELAKLAEMMTDEFTQVGIRFTSVNQALMFIGSEIERYQGPAIKMPDIMNVTQDCSEFRKEVTYTIRNCTSRLDFHKKLKSYGMMTDAKSYEQDTSGLWICKGLDRGNIVIGIDGTATGSIIYVYDI